MKKLKTLKGRNWITLLIFALVIAAVYHITLTSKSLFVSNDGMGYYLAKIFMVDGIKNGEFPLWNPYLSIGTNFFGDVQNTVFSPLNLLYVIFDTTFAYNLTHIIQLIIAGYFMYLLICLLTDRYYVSVVFGFVFAFSTFLAGRRLEHPTIITTIALFPVILFCMEKYRETGGERWVILSDVIMAIQFISGFTQIVLYFDIALFVYLLSICIDKRKSWKSTCLLGIKWIGSYILLIGIQLLPMAVLTVQSGRDEMPWLGFSVLAYDLRVLWMMIFPDAYLNHFEPFGDYNSSGIDIEIYIGIICLVYCIYELRYHWKEKRVKVLFGILSGAFIYGMAPNIPVLGRIIYHIPLLNSFRVCARTLSIFTFLLILLAALGAADIYKEDSLKKLSKINGYLLGITVTVALFSSSVFSQGALKAADSSYAERMCGQSVWIPCLLLGIHLIGLLVIRKRNQLTNLVICILGIVMVLDVARYNMTGIERMQSVQDALDDGVSEEAAELIAEATRNQYRVFADIKLAGELLKDSLAIAKYNRPYYSESRIYNSYLTFLDKKLGYWEIKETALYPEFVNKIQNNPDFVSMLGIQYILTEDTEEKHSFTVDTGEEKELLVTDEAPVSDQADTYYAYAHKAGSLKKGEAYLVTAQLEAGAPETFYADFIGTDYDGENVSFQKREEGVWEALVILSDRVDNAYVRIIGSGQEAEALKGVRVERVAVKDCLELVTKSEDGISVYRNTAAKPLIYIPDYVCGIDGYSESYKEDCLQEVDIRSYIQGFGREMDLSQGNGEVLDIQAGRNSVSAAVSAETEIFVNHSQLSCSGWKAYIDGEETTLYTVNNLIQGIVVPAGSHRIEFRYRPMELYVGIAWTVCGNIVLVIWALRAGKRRER